MSEKYTLSPGAQRWWKDSRGTVLTTVDVDIRYESGRVVTKKTEPTHPDFILISENEALRLLASYDVEEKKEEEENVDE